MDATEVGAATFLSPQEMQPVELLTASALVCNTLDLGVKIRKDRLRAIEDVVFALGLLVGNTTRHLASAETTFLTRPAPSDDELTTTDDQSASS